MKTTTMMMTMIVAAVTHIRESKSPSTMPTYMIGSRNGPRSMVSQEQQRTVKQEAGAPGPAGVASTVCCFALLKVSDGVPGNSAPGTTHLLPKKEKERERTTKKAGARPERNVPRHATPPHSRSCTAVSLPFLPVPVRLLCGRLPHRAPLVLPARPRADRTTLLLSRHQHALCLVGEFTPPLGTRRSDPRVCAHRSAQCRLISATPPRL